MRIIEGVQSANAVRKKVNMRKYLVRLQMSLTCPFRRSSVMVIWKTIERQTMLLAFLLGGASSLLGLVLKYRVRACCRWVSKSCLQMLFWLPEEQWPGGT